MVTTKKCVLFIFLVFVWAGLAAQKVRVKGTASFADPVSQLYLYYDKDNGEKVRDSTSIKNGKFKFMGELDIPVLATLWVSFMKKEGKTRNPERVEFYLEDGVVKIDIKDSAFKAIVSGSKSQKDFETMNLLVKPYEIKNQVLRKDFSDMVKKNDSVKMEEITKAVRNNNLTIKELRKQFILGHPYSFVSLKVLQDYAGVIIDPAITEPLFNSLADNIKTTESGKKFFEKIVESKITAVGTMAMNFTQNDTAGKPVSLSDFRGKYVLLDFWASWCGPCRAENPNVVKAFNQYKEKNFTVLGVSLDQPDAKEKWLQAIYKDGLTWTQVSDLKFWNNAVAKQYRIHSIPQNFLIDPSGKIIAKNIRGDELQKKLAEVLD